VPRGDQRFAGDDISRAVFHPEDVRYLIDREVMVTHYELRSRHPSVNLG
jgi:hypothetical protein